MFDSNKDGRLQLSEMAKLLPVKENFLCRQIFKVILVQLLIELNQTLYIIAIHIMVQLTI